MEGALRKVSLAKVAPLFDPDSVVRPERRFPARLCLGNQRQHDRLRAGASRSLSICVRAARGSYRRTTKRRGIVSPATSLRKKGAEATRAPSPSPPSPKSWGHPAGRRATAKRATRLPDTSKNDIS